MGQTLSEPITNKETASLQNSAVKVGSSSMQGWRISMEDAHTHLLKLADDQEAMFFGVYDGHGGAKIASHVSRHLHKHILEQPEYKQGDIKDAIVKGFLHCDDSMRQEESLKDEMSGSTAITVLIKGSTLYANNVGDSRCVAQVRGAAEALSVDHKPGDEPERQRIESAGGFVEFNRVNGNLALSRALGDFAFKGNDTLSAEEQIVSGCPDVQVRTVDEDWEFLILACDGIWDVLSNQEVCDFVCRRVGEGMEPEDVCEELMTRCLASDCAMGGLGCDNMTVILVCFLHGQPYQKLVDRCRVLTAKRDAERKEESSDEDAEDEKEEGRSNGEAGEAEEEDEEGGEGRDSKISKLEADQKAQEAKEEVDLKRD